MELRAPEPPEGSPRPPLADRFVPTVVGPGELSLSEVVAAVLRANRDRQRGVTMREAAWAIQDEGLLVPRSLPALWRQAVEAGALLRVGGPPGMPRFAHRSMAMEIRSNPFGARRVDDFAMVRDAVVAAWERLRRPVSLAEVVSELRGAKVRLRSQDELAVRRRLQALARGAADPHRIDRGLMITRRLSVGQDGRQIARYSAGGEQVPPEQPPSAEAIEAIRYVVAIASTALARPLSERDIKLWVRSHPASLATRKLQGLDVHQVLGMALTVGRGTAVRSGVRLTSAQSTDWGTTPRRYVAGSSGDHPPFAARLEHVALALRVADEVDQLADLRREAARERQPCLAGLVREREGLLYGALWRVAGSDSHLLQDVSQALYASYAVERRWIRMAYGESQAVTILGRVAERERHVRAAVEVLRQVRTDVERIYQRHTTWVDKEYLRLWIDSVRAHFPDRVITDETCLQGVLRRQPPTSHAAHPAVERASWEFDRVAALVRLYSMCNPPQTMALLIPAAQLLGPLLRDPALVSGVLRERWDKPGLRRDVTTIALALLGIEWRAQRHGTADDGDPFSDRVRLLRSLLASGGVAGELLRSVPPDTADRVVRRYRARRVIFAAE